ncbi:DUF3899 domain-containing protein [Staphylococcus xylosus]|nr:DUF3899 domain-containing protein [Staphylococcus xylosus]ARD74005.1 hypothetical protein AWC37_02310 [Staphylococcus xylosus]KTW20568.1 membrane protein [Staphylococcus xylosus]MBO3074912.1 DUF3899 domain-containing protein [Staphylococcus xylosus]MBU6132234.1 DUF3899 domain-containing protein [Staphylococcus xylosus]MBV5140228.1 DUF3899 domain-containing protein [Staphylococcus xylosus]
MKNITSILGWALLTPILSLLFWFFVSHTLIYFINIFFYISISLTIFFFIIIIVQEGIFDPTSYGFRRLKYQLSSKKHKDTMENDEFFKPKQVKKDDYFVSSWVKIAFSFNLFYLILTIVISFSI